MEKENSKPVARFSSGQIHVAVWENASKEGGTFNTLTVQKRYKSGDEWKTAKSFRPSEIPKLIFALQQAQERYGEKGGGDAVSGEGQRLVSCR